MDPITARYATRNVPRYTSYPTAPHFSADVDPDTYTEWLRAVPDTAELSVYLHVPFCREMCHYCGCYTKVTRHDEPLYAYAETLAAEILLIQDLIGSARKVRFIHWGGGTPSLLPVDAFQRVIQALYRGFLRVEGAEHAMELDPRTVTPDMARALGEAGITRASLGVQDFDPAVQEAIGRVQPYEIVESAAAALRENGIDAINLDLMYGLPHQTEQTMRETVDRALGLNPSRFALFGYAHVPWMKKHQRLIDEASLPGVDGRIALQDAARERLEENGFESIGLDHFARADDDLAIAARTGKMRRNFQGYTTDDAEYLIGLGASSIGKLPQGYVQNAPDIGGWQRAIEAGTPPIMRGKALSDDDRARAAIIETLMTDYTVDVAEVAAAHGQDIAEYAASFDRLGEMIADGLVSLAGTRITIGKAGRPFVRVAAAAFDSYLASAAARHSVAV